MTHTTNHPPANISLADLQALIKEMYFEKDQARGLEGTFLWFAEEVGELATSLRSGSHEERLGEFADVLAWLATAASSNSPAPAIAIFINQAPGIQRSQQSQRPLGGQAESIPGLKPEAMACITPPGSRQPRALAGRDGCLATGTPSGAPSPCAMLETAQRWPFN